jgi:hypothetical protein
MKPAKNIEKLIKDVELDTNAPMDKAVLDDVLNALEESKKKKSPTPQPNMWRLITKSRITKLAAAAVVVIAVLIGTEMFSTSDKQPGGIITQKQGVPDKEVVTRRKRRDEGSLNAERELALAENVDTQLKKIEQMYAAGDVDGLATMLSTGQLESKVVAANCLAEMEGGTKALAALEKVYAEYGADDTENAFRPAIEKIRNRMEAAGGKSPARTLVAKADGSATLAKSLERDEIVSADTSAEAEELLEPTDETGHFERVVADGYPVKGGQDSVAQMVPSSLHENLVSYYSFHAASDADTVTDISGAGYHGQVHGAQYVNDEVLGGAMNFDGKDDQISIPDVHLEQFTFSAWVAPVGRDLNNRQIFLLSDGKNYYSLQGNTGGGVSVVADDLEMNEYNWRLNPDTWTHLTVTGDGRTFSVYRNGQLTETGEIEIETAGVAGTLHIGGAGPHGGRYWNGFMDEVAVFGQALTDEEVEQLYLMTGEMIEASELTEEPMEESEKTGELISADTSAEAVESFEPMDESEYFEQFVADGYPVSGGYSSITEVVPSSLHENVVSYYSFHAASDADTVTDISGAGYHGQVHGAQYVNDEVLGGAMNFDGKDDQISIPDVHLEQFTFSAWVAPVDGHSNNQQIFLLSDGVNHYALQGNSRGGVGVYVSDGTDDIEINEYNWRLNPDTWTHLTVTGDGHTFSIYRNGRLTETGQIEIETAGVTGTLYIGGADRDGGRYWNGFMDEVGVFSRVLTDQEVGQLYLMTGEMIETPETTK